MISVTPTAASKISRNLERRGSGVGIRLGTRTTGCSGLAYVLEYVDSLTTDDQCFESQGCKVCLVTKCLAYIQGVEVDWVRNGLNEGFEFRNPNERDRCGCGESFRV